MKKIALSDITAITIILGLFWASNSHAAVSSLEPSSARFSFKHGSAPSLYTGDLGVGIPVMTVPGRAGASLKINLGYSAGVRMEDEASWLGLGWNIGVGEIVREVNHYPDDSPLGWLNDSDTSYCDTTDDDRMNQDNWYLNLGSGMQKMVFLNEKQDGSSCGSSCAGVTRRVVTQSWKPWIIEYDTNSADEIIS